MDATAVNAVSPLATSTATATTTNGPSSSGPTAGGGPVPAPAQPTLLGVKLLPAPAGKPETIHLNDGSLLVPLAKVDARGTIHALDDSSARAATAALPATPASPTTGTAARPATPATPSTFEPGGFEPKGFLYKGNYYKKFQDSTAIDIANLGDVQEKVTRGTLGHVRDEEQGWNGFGVTDVKTRRVDPNADRDLLNVDPNAAYYVEVTGVTGTGEQKMIPSVVETDGDVFVDPRISSG
jgi:hypothetical protein